MKKEFTWQIIKKKQTQIIAQIIFIIIIITLHPPIGYLIPIITTYIVIKSVITKKTIKETITAIITTTIILAIFYAISYFIGPLYTIILVHVLGVPLIIWSKRKFIKIAYKEMTTYCSYLGKKNRRYKEWKKQQIHTKAGKNTYAKTVKTCSQKK